MNNKAIGAIFCLIASLLYCTRYIAAAIFHIGFNEYSDGTFSSMLDRVGSNLLTLSILSLIIGLIYLTLSWIKKDK